MTRRFVFVEGMAALLAQLVLAGCAAQPRDCAMLQVRCAGLVTDFGSVEEGIAHEAWLALEDARSSGLLERVDFIETVDIRDREANIVALASSGYDIIITVGAGMIEETHAVAARYPALYFIGLHQYPEPPLTPGNYATLVFHEEHSGFLAGAVAGLITQSGRVAAVCEVEFIDSVRRTCSGFQLGAVHANPMIEVDVLYRSGPEELLFRDREWGTETARLSVERGADVVFAVGEETATAALEAGARGGAMVIGAETDQSNDVPELGTALVTSATLDIRGGLYAMLREAAEGRFRAGQHWGGVGLVSIREFDGRLSPAARTRLNEITEDLLAGAIRVDADP